MNERVVVILGTTASGKTDLAIYLAKKFCGEIISADSRQVYIGMDIGSGKELFKYKNVSYHLIDILSPKKQFNVAEYQKLAFRAIDDIRARGKLPILCGGGGLYIDAVLKGYIFGMTHKKSAMTNIRKRLEKMPLVYLLKELEKRDFETYRTIDKKNRRRVLRALEIYSISGKTKSEQLRAQKPFYEFLKIGVTHPKDILQKKIQKRLETRLKSGLIEEVRRLHLQGVLWRRLDEFGLEYRWVSRYVRGKMTKEEMKKEIIRSSVNFSKRQMTWFKRDKEIHWIQNKNEAKRLVKTFLSFQRQD